MSHTKGEWSFGHNVGVFSGDIHIADIAPVENGFDETLANAKLISAAPDLLEALTMFLKVINRSDTALEHYGEAISMADAAITKAVKG